MSDLNITQHNIRAGFGKFIFSARWILYPVNIGLVAALLLYVCRFLYEDYEFIFHSQIVDLESLMVILLGFVDASMVANLIIMIVQGSHQIFIHKFELPDKAETPQYLDHIDTGILKVKIAMSISGITLVQLLKDFVNLEHVDWELAKHRIYIHVITLVSVLFMAVVWRVTHPRKEGKTHEK